MSDKNTVVISTAVFSKLNHLIDLNWFGETKIFGSVNKTTIRTKYGDLITERVSGKIQYSASQSLLDSCNM